MAKEKMVEVPSMKGMGTAFKKFAWGLGGGLGFLLLYSIFGPLGLIAAPVVIGSVFKGEQGEDIAFLSGFLALALGAISGGLGGAQASEETANGLAV